MEKSKAVQVSSEQRTVLLIFLTTVAMAIDVGMSEKQAHRAIKAAFKVVRKRRVSASAEKRFYEHP